MCGIVGSVGWGDRYISEMNESQFHRGPDDGGTWEGVTASNERICLGSRRLSIIDVSNAGHMPMQTDDENYTIVFNGEVYNFREIRSELKKKGHSFRSGTDTEVVLKAYIEYGERCVERFNGMFALAIWDKKEDLLFLARDHFGIKPLYYAEGDRRIAFASELKSLRVLPDIEFDVDTNSLFKYLTFLWVPEPDTIVSQVKKIPAGHFAIYRNGQLSIRKFWDLKFPTEEVKCSNRKELIDQLRHELETAIERQMVSDVPVGAFLSAGLDSSSIVALMSKFAGYPVKTYTIGFHEKHQKGGQVFDDVDVASRTAEQFGCDHTNLIVDPDVSTLLPELIYCMDEPVSDPAIIMAYLVTKEASKDVKVLLSGAGGDEIFGGYRKYRAHDLALKYQKIPKFLRTSVLEPIMATMPSMPGSSLASPIRLAKKMARSGSLAPNERFIMDSVYGSRASLAELVEPGLWQELNSMNESEIHESHFDSVSESEFLNQMLYVDSKVFMPSLNLLYNDKMSMANSLESRVPLIDCKLAEWAAQNIPVDMKINGSITKFAFREAMRGTLSDEVLEQKKSSFGAPIGLWLANDLKEMTQDILGSNSFRNRGIFNLSAVDNLLEKSSRSMNENMFIWQLLTLELWHQKFIDKQI